MTNQASEDRLIEWIVEHTGLVEETEGTVWREFDVDTFAYHLQALIRNEKLKLLAEVRERVVGEDVDLTAEHIRKSFTTKEIPLLMANRQLRKEQRIELTKLEAEL